MVPTTCCAGFSGMCRVSALPQDLGDQVENTPGGQGLLRNQAFVAEGILGGCEGRELAAPIHPDGSGQFRPWDKVSYQL